MSVTMSSDEEESLVAYNLLERSAMPSTSGTWSRAQRKIYTLPNSEALLTQRVNAVFKAEGEKGRGQSKMIATPPYVTARPDVAFRKIHRSGEKLKFVVLATDGRKLHHLRLYRDVG
jgi:hypothetical protein